jgi:hypothetical protein
MDNTKALGRLRIERVRAKKFSSGYVQADWRKSAAGQNGL